MPRNIPFLLDHLDNLLNSLPDASQRINKAQFARVLSDLKKTWLNPNTKKFEEAVFTLPDIAVKRVDLDKKNLKVISAKSLTNEQNHQLVHSLKQLTPWRKGPFALFGINLDAEWNSNLKWGRVEKYLPALNGKNVLDVGCSNGYYMFRLARHQPRFMLGIDPLQINFYQFSTLQKYFQIPDCFFAPIKLQDIEAFYNFFHVVFCMGVLYHQKSPMDALRDLRNLTKKQGSLVLETLIIPGKKEICLSPKKNVYAKMPNVYFIPTLNCLLNWLQKSGFRENKVISIAKTTTKEQRKTEWMEFESLFDFLDPQNSGKTIEGYPAPRRVIIISSPY